MRPILLYYFLIVGTAAATQPVASITADSMAQYCTPGVANKSRAKGVELTYHLTGGGLIERQEGKMEQVVGHMDTRERFAFKVRVPLLLRPEWKVLVGYDFQPERYRFGLVDPEVMPLLGNLDARLLKSNGFNLSAIRSFNATYYAAFNVGVNFNGDYDGWVDLGRQYAAYSALGLLGIKKSNDLEWGAGLVYLQNMRRRFVLPFLLYNKNFNERWGIETALPLYALGRYNAGPRSILLFGTEFNGRMYAISPNAIGFIQDRANPTYSRAELSALVSWEQQVVPWIWINVKTGYQINFNSRFEAALPGTPLLSIRPPNALFVQVGLFLSPPDSFLK